MTKRKTRIHRKHQMRKNTRTRKFQKGGIRAQRLFDKTLRMAYSPTIEEIQALGTDVNEVVDSDGRTLLHYAIKHHPVHIAQALLEQGANPNVLDKDNNTPLHLLIGQNPITIQLFASQMPFNVEEARQMSQLLIEHGARTDIKNKYKYTVIDVARIRNLDDEFMDLLEGRLARTPLHVLEFQEGRFARTPLNVPEFQEGEDDQPTYNQISYVPIQNGNKLVNFHGESRHGRFYTENTYNDLPIPRLNPHTRASILPKNVTYHTARIVRK